MHAKASTKCPYLTLKNPHHQRQHCALECSSVDDVRHHRIRAAEDRPAHRLDDAGDGIDFKNPFTMSKTDDGANAGGRIADTRRQRQTGCLILKTRIVGGANRDRTDDLKLAKLALSQLS